MAYETILVKEIPLGKAITINRTSNNNSISKQLLLDIHHVLDQVENDKNYLLITLEGQNGLFCTGMDFQEILAFNNDANKIREWAALYMRMLRRFATGKQIIIAKVDGKAIAGGVGFVAASDYAIAAEKAEFKLTEVLWGLLPAMVAPYLIKRIGHQKAYEMTMTARAVHAEEALSFHLVDEVNSQFDTSLEELTRRIKRLQPNTIQAMKSYFRGLWFIDDAMEKNAIEETTKRLQMPEVLRNIRTFVENQNYKI